MSLFKKAFVPVLAIIASTAFPLDGQSQTKQPNADGQAARATARQRRRARSPRLTPAGVITRSGLTFLRSQKGTGRLPQRGETVVVHYTGTLTNGVRFDSSHNGGQPLAFKLGVGQVIKGWDEGIALMRAGDRAILVIPPKLGYGAKGAGSAIPPDATLIFVVELLDIKPTSMTDVLSKTLTDKGMDAMVTRYRELKAAGGEEIYASEGDMNGWGYRLLGKKKIPEAVEVFKLNVEAYPQSANVYDSLAEAYVVQGDKPRAIENYRKALEINPQMESARKALRELEGK